MRNIKRATCITMVFVMLLVSVLAGCGKSVPNADIGKTATAASTAAATTVTDPNSNDISQEVTLKTWLLGDKPADFDFVYGEMNKVLKEKVNATMDINYIPWSDYSTKYSLLFSSGESFDIVYTATWTPPNFKVLASKNAFMELTPDMLKKYAPKSYAEMPEIAWKQVMVNGKIFTIPSSNDEFGKYVAVIRGDLREKYKLPEVNSTESLKNYLLTIAKNEKGIIPFDCGEQGGKLATIFYTLPNNIYSLPYGVGTYITDPDLKLFNVYEDPKYLEFLNLMKFFKDNGVIPSDAASKKYMESESFIAGKSATMIWNIINSGVAVRQVLAEHPEWKPEMVDTSPDAATIVQQYSNNGNAIKADSKNWQRALMVIELLRTDKSLWDLSNYGIIGKHWEPVGDNKFKSLPDSKNFLPNSNCQWGWNTPFIRFPADMPDVYFKMLDNWASKKANFLLNGFQMDLTNIKSEDAVMQNLGKQYGPLTLGAFPEPEKTLAEYIAKEKAGGLDKILEELKKQAAEYIASMK